MTVDRLQEKIVQLDRHGRSLPVFCAEPEQPGQYPAVIVIHEIFGLNDHIKDVATRFAKAGICAYAPDLFAGAPNLPADTNNLNAMRAVWQAIPDDQLIKDLQAVFELAKGSDKVDTHRIGTLGYCMGGAIALMFAASTPGIAWIADYYGRIFYPNLSEKKPKHPIDYIDTLNCPFLGLFAGKDELITAEHVAELKQRLAANDKQFFIKVYDKADHAFFNDQRAHYNEDAANDAWNKTLALIENSSTNPVRD